MASFPGISDPIFSIDKLAPIALFVYNRLHHVQQTVSSLQKNILADASDLIVYSDGPKGIQDKKNVEDVRKYVRSITGFKSLTIVEREKNHGLAKSIISGITDTVHRYGKIIVVEDDLITSPFFLEFMNKNLQIYEQEEKVISIHGYFYPVKNPGGLPKIFFLKGADCWGWATWKRGWDLFNPDGRYLHSKIKNTNREYEFNINGSYDFMKMLTDCINGKNDSWAVRWYASAFLHGKLTLYPSRSLVQNIGNDCTGTHRVVTDRFLIYHDLKQIDITRIPIEICQQAQEEMEFFFRKILFPWYHRYASFLKKLIYCIR